MTGVYKPFNTYTIVDNFTTSREYYLSTTGTPTGFGYSINGGTLTSKAYVYLEGTLYNGGSILGNATLNFIGGGVGLDLPIGIRCDGRGGSYTPALGLNIVINTPGTFEINAPGSSGTFYLTTGATFTWVAGTITWTGYTWAMYVLGNAIFRTSGITIPSVAFSSSQVQFNETFNVTKFWIYGTTRFSGSSGANINILEMRTALNLDAGRVYNITGSITSTGLTSSITSQRSNLTGINGVTKLNVSPGATMKLGALDINRIDASGGRKLWTWDSTITDCINVSSFTDIQGISQNY
jgi:hypothetical protein